MSRTTHELSLTDAAAAYARAHNTMDPSHLKGLLSEDFRYASQWEFDEMEGAAAYLDYLARKLEAIRSSGSAVTAELASTQPYPMAPNRPVPCVVMAQDGAQVATVLFQVKDGRITRIDMCQIPPPESCVGTGEYPGINGSKKGWQA